MVGLEAKNPFFQNVVMLHITLKGIKKLYMA